MMKVVVLHGVCTDTQTGSSHTYECQDKSVTMPHSDQICVSDHDTSIHTAYPQSITCVNVCVSANMMVCSFNPKTSISIQKHHLYTEI